MGILETGNDWFDDYVDEQEEYQIDEYELTATPNDFNVATIYNFIESGSVKIPGFQRNYVWDIKRASKLVESLILGLPVPQIFLYEEGRNRFLVIDGQQRLMSLYYFVKQRFPRKEKRPEIRRIFDERGSIPDEVLHDDTYFGPFALNLPENLPNRQNKFKGMNYSTLGDYKTQFELRPVRNVIVKQNVPRDDHSSIFEIFNRLNTGGINLQPQEIRASLYHSSFYDMLYRINAHREWRRLLRMPEPDLHMKDIEIIMRGFAMLVAGEKYAPSMTKFLNQYSRDSKKNSNDTNQYLQDLFVGFLEAASGLPGDIFVSRRTKRFNIALFEAVFVGACYDKFKVKALPEGALSAAEIDRLDSDEEFVSASQRGTTKSINVEKRLSRAREIISKL